MNITELTLKGNNATIPDFIAYYETIPEERWCVDLLTDGHNRCCARGHLGTIGYCETLLDARLLKLAPDLVEHNNDEFNKDSGWWLDDRSTLNSSAKARVLAYLRSLL